MFSIDLTSRIPIYEQIYEKIIGLILNGTLKENDQLPSVRSLAKSTGVNPNTVAKAYQELERNKIIYSVPGRGSFISAQDNDEFRAKVLEDFDSAVNEALDRGITTSELKDRLDTLGSAFGKENKI
ncbi:GntR family transcriptional regulator [Ruminococcus sp. XPD3002]|uniref:GntR family transcriptional regulator n=1 Tax=Ruminococcus sp. XPD3002 TaxID=1452269 RepID=UPI00091FBEC8|nr:GntR family transcriptional regulator [Ruminococcus sp.]SFX27212.1 GntR family transcriptional regulator [Ruminococcus flavefaciens]HPY86206.1 GntR family transcriptional regulator [Ruminococcus flavefaciens]